VSSIEQQQEWLIEFMTSDRARAAAEAQLHRGRVAWYDPEDLWNDCVAALMVTCRNAAARGTVLANVNDVDEAERYARSALKHRAMDLFRGETRRPGPFSFTPDDEDGHDRDVASAADTATIAIDAQVAAQLRFEITNALTTGGIVCTGCQPVVVAAIALRLIDRYWTSDDVDTPSWGTAELPGADELSGAIYEALDAVKPGSVVVDGPRVADRSRKMKSRCQRCVTPLLTQALKSVGLAPPQLPPDDRRS